MIELLTFPYSGYSGPMVVVANNESHHNNVQLSAIDYLYRDAVIHKQGLGFCGFREIVASNQLKNSTMIATYDPLKRGVLTEIFIPGMSETSCDYEIVLQKNHSRKINLKNKTSFRLSKWYNGKFLISA